MLANQCRWRSFNAGCLGLSLTLYFIFVVGFMNMQSANAAAVMSVDLGTEWMKVGVVSPGVPMEIALNRESKRKTPAILAFRDGMRTFGEDAQTIGIREPSAAYGYLLDLLGKTIDNPIVDLYRKRFPYYDIVGDLKRNTVVFKRGDDETFSVEELIAQMLVKAKEFAQESTQQPIAECVLTVPGYFGQAEREALLAAAQLANLKVLQLINDYAAVALNYGVFHRGEINETAQYFLFYDMGAYKTSAAVVSYQLVKDKQTKETNPVVQVLGVGFDRTLGGLEIQLRLRDYLADEFNALKKTKTDVKSSPRALAKLFKEAGRLKNVLSANNDHYAQIENLIEDNDFKLQVTREKLEELCADLWPRATKPLEQALASSNLSLDVINQVILFGGGTRVPRVQETIKALIKQELGKNLNADESATMGAVYKAADLSAGFKVKKFVVKDAVLYPLQVAFERDPGDGAAVKHVKRSLFALMNPYPQKKVITFNKHTDDFEFFVNYGDLERYTPEEVAAIGSLNITRVELKQVKELLEKSKKESVDNKGIKAYFYLDDSGIFRCTGVEYVYDKQKLVEEGDEDSTLAKLGSTISKLFTKDGEKASDNADASKKDQDQEQEEQATGDDGSKSESSKRQASDAEEQAQNKPDESKPETEKNKEKEKNETIKLVTIKTPVVHSTHLQFAPPLSGAAYDSSQVKLQAINKAEEHRVRLESAFNALESHIIEVQQKLDEEQYGSCATDAEKEKLLSECSTLSEWLYEDHENPVPELYEDKLTQLKKLSNVFLARHWEHEERPEAIKALKGMIDGADKFLLTARNLTKDINPDKDVFTQVEIDTLIKVISETNEWVETEKAAQNKLKRNAEVRLTVKDITEKMALLDREVKYLVNKIKIWKPKAKPADKEKTKETEKDGSGDQHGSADKEEPAQAEPPSTDQEHSEEATETPSPDVDDKTPHGEL
ncbi:hypoxia up-regulated protein 1 [Scaptodrosophila lebanonensis]|uniref:Hypoxia up-regulated protein 1 n=1 Tax=Drosophila lebanonensis TaxID=7225 RepID=A0A6J2TS81_DROLE|nr:hypoxia up-regulated protein 1 [Scaptodrosophila lebanonensis]XP_030379486.1 hypoxia up-regulated protein 1 [Scaptodrosophila lebanonensis]